MLFKVFEILDVIASARSNCRMTTTQGYVENVKMPHGVNNNLPGMLPLHSTILPLTLVSTLAAWSRKSLMILWRIVEMRATERQTPSPSYVYHIAVHFAQEPMEERGLVVLPPFHSSMVQALHGCPAAPVAWVLDINVCIMGAENLCVTQTSLHPPTSLITPCVLLRCTVVVSNSLSNSNITRGHMRCVI